MVGVNIIDRRQSGGIHLLARDMNIHLVEFVQVIIDIFRWIIGQKRITDTH